MAYKNSIAFVGLSGVGKTTSAYYLQTKYKYKLHKLASPLYKIQNEFYNNIGVFEDFQDGELLSLLASRVQKYSPEFLINQFIKNIEFESFIVNDDCRRENLQILRDLGFVIIKILATPRTRKEDISHPLDNGVEWTVEEIKSLSCDYCIYNDGTCDELYNSLDSILGDLCG